MKTTHHHLLVLLVTVFTTLPLSAENIPSSVEWPSPLFYLSSLLVGFMLTTLGSGAGLVTVPTLIYICLLSAQSSVGHAIVIVGLCALFSFLSQWNKGFKVIKAYWPFVSKITLSHIAGLGLGSWTSLNFLSHQMITTTLAFLVIAGSVWMIVKNILSSLEPFPTPEGPVKNHIIPLSAGFISGIFGGVTGVGGGFIIVPVCYFFLGINFSHATLISLFMIFTRSFFGAGMYFAHLELKVFLVILFVICSFPGIMLGKKCKTLFSERQLKSFFSFFLLCIGLFILFNN